MCCLEHIFNLPHLIRCKITMHIALISTTTSLSLLAHHDLPNLTSYNIPTIPTTTSLDTHILTESVIYGTLYQSSTLITLYVYIGIIKKQLKTFLFTIAWIWPTVILSISYMSMLKMSINIQLFSQLQ